MFVPWWLLAGVAGVLVTWGWCRRYVRRHEILTVRAWWARLPRERREEILYVRERLHRNGASYIQDYSRASDAQLDEWFENSLRNALGGDSWAFELLKEQVFGHVSAAGLLHPAAPTART
ncbi:hypothetical protein [Myxococcus sp. AB056]|uniref:hypothetical protein n=1 Tax=Myxococcus sp. AB056 TaxID=2562792 RepID=UPI0011464EEE|nr:hypothetical protein [Myxococcus sp. AB056]